LFQDLLQTLHNVKIESKNHFGNLIKKLGSNIEEKLALTLILPLWQHVFHRPPFEINNKGELDTVIAGKLLILNALFEATINLSLKVISKKEK